MALSMQVIGLEDMIHDFSKAGVDAKPLIRAAIQNSVQRIQKNVRGRAKHRTGTLQRSVLTQVNYPNGQVEVQEKYGEYIEYGTGIYGPKHTPIRPKAAKALYFKVAGQPVFARSVKGMRPAPFFKPGVEESKTYVDEQFDKVAQILVRHMAGK